MLQKYMFLPVRQNCAVAAAARHCLPDVVVEHTVGVDSGRTLVLLRLAIKRQN